MFQNYANTSPKVFTLTQNGSQLTLDMDACDPNESVLQGSVSADAFSAQGVDRWGDSYQVDGSMEGDGLTGTLYVNGQGPVIWTAARGSAEGTCPSFTVPTASIVVDGNTSDWAGIQSALTDDSGDGDGTSGSDLSAVYLAKDGSNLYVRLDLTDGPPSSEKFYGVALYSHKYCRKGDQYIHFVMSQQKVYIYSRVADGSQYGEYVAEGQLAVSGNTIEAAVPLADIRVTSGAYSYAWSDYEGLNNAADWTDWTKVTIESVETGCSGALIGTIDGLNWANTFNPSFWEGVVPDWNRTECYLKSSLQSLDLGVPTDDIFCVRWSGDAMKSAQELPNIIEILRAQQTQAKLENKKYVLVTHSWGTFLAYMAMSTAQDIKPDLFITLSAPQGSIYSDCCCFRDCKYVEWMVDAFWRNRAREVLGLSSDAALTMAQPQPVRWVNFWAWGDLISGPLKSLADSVNDIALPDIGFNNSRYRTIGTTPQWHDYTGMPDDCPINSTVYCPSFFKDLVAGEIVNTVNKDCSSGDAPKAPTLLSPQQGEVLSAGSVDFKWSPVSGVNQYYGLLWRNIDDSYLTFGAESNERSINCNYPGNTWYWRVAPMSGGQKGTWSELRVFSTKPNSIDGASRITKIYSACYSFTDYSKEEIYLRQGVSAPKDWSKINVEVINGSPGIRYFRIAITKTDCGPLEITADDENGGDTYELASYLAPEEEFTATWSVLTKNLNSNDCDCKLKIELKESELDSASGSTVDSYELPVITWDEPCTY